MRSLSWIERASLCAVLLAVDAVSAPSVPATVQVPAKADESARVDYSKAVRAAASCLAKGDLDAAQSALDSASLELRDFEWRHVKLCVDLARVTTAGLSSRAGVRPHVESGTAKATPVTVLRGQIGACRGIAFSPAGDRIATAALDPSIRLWNARTGDSVRVLGGHEGAVLAIAYSPNGSQLLSASDDGSARLWNANSGECTLVLRAGTSPLTAVAWSRDGSVLATAAADRAIRIWLASATEPRIALRGHEQKITSIVFSKDGGMLVSGSEDQTVRVWNLATGDCVRVLHEAALAVTGVAFSPSGEQFASTSLDARLRVWDLASGALVRTVLGQGEALSLAYSPDGRRIVTTAMDGSVRVIDAQDGLPLLVLRGHEGPVRGAAFAPNGDRLATCGDDRTVRIFETDAVVARTAQREAVVDLPPPEVAALSKPLEIEAMCARIVQRPGLETKMYEDAEALLRAALDRLPESGQIHTTLGGAQYRLEKYTEALEALTLAGEKKKGWPPNLAFRAMTLAQLDRIDEARAMVTRLSTLVREDRWAQDVEAAALLEEARNLLTAKSPVKK
jgi:hypothetical protein